MQPVRKLEIVKPVDTKMALTEHLDELRKVAVRIVIALAVGLCFTYNYSDVIVHFLELPLLSALPKDQAQLIFTGLTDKFMVYFKVSVLASLLLTFPYVLYQIWSFLSPALEEKEKKLIFPFIIFGTVAFVVGLAFCYYIVLPPGYEYLVKFGSSSNYNTEKAMISITEYFSITLQLLFAVGLIFELPVVLMVLGRAGIVSSNLLVKYRKQALLASAFVAAIATPSPDAFSMVLVMIPLYLLYEVGIVGIKLMNK